MFLLFLWLAQLPPSGRVCLTDIFQSAGHLEGWPFGSVVAVPGDLDGDAHVDFIVSEPRSRVAAARRGRVLLYSGKDRCVLHFWTGRPEDEYFGFSLAAGDLDGDALEDLVIGALGPDGGVGRVTAYSGRTFQELASFESGTPGDDFGWSLAVGDVDGDTQNEVVVGAPSALDGAGSVLLFEVTGEVHSVLHGFEAGDRFGWSLLAEADFDRDGVLDLAIGAPRARGQGSVSLYSVVEGLERVRLFGGRPGDQFGFSMAVLPHPILPQLAVGSPGRDEIHEGEGVVTLFHADGEADVQWSGCSGTPASRFAEPAFGGSPTPLRRPARDGEHHYGCIDGMRFGHALVGLPDIDGRGTPGLAISAPAGFSSWGGRNGWITVLSANSEGVNSRIAGSAPSWLFGASLAAFLCDDGRGSLLVGGPGDGHFTAGKVEVFRLDDLQGKTPTDSTRVDPPEVSMR